MPFSSFLNACVGTFQQWKIAVTWTIIIAGGFKMCGATRIPTGYKYASVTVDVLCELGPCGAEVFWRVRALLLQMIRGSPGHSPLKKARFHWETRSLICCSTVSSRLPGGGELGAGKQFFNNSVRNRMRQTHSIGFSNFVKIISAVKSTIGMWKQS